MKTRIYILSLFIIPFFLSCGNRRIEMISENSGLILPKHYKVLKNETKSFGISDFEVTVIIEFKSDSYEILVAQIDKLADLDNKWQYGDSLIKYFNHLNASETETISINTELKRLTYKFEHL
ncbi:MAG: hypothetical protein GQ564_10285 [Bacteroidales bacterium]|nr:hypothetical protein [Bacteroidales bacterium]